MPARIRGVEIADAQAVRDIYAPFVTDAATSFETVAPDLAEMTRRIEAQRERYPWLVFERDGEVLGYAYASAHRARQAYQWSVEVSVYIDPRAHRSGLGRALYTALFEVLRRQGYVNAYAGITLPNAASVGLHESLGFMSVGVYSRIGFKFDAWHDVLWLQLRLLEDPRPLHDPLPLAGLLQQPPVVTMLDACARTVHLDAAAR